MLFLRIFEELNTIYPKTYFWTRSIIHRKCYTSDRGVRFQSDFAWWTGGPNLLQRWDFTTVRWESYDRVVRIARFIIHKLTLLVPVLLSITIISNKYLKGTFFLFIRVTYITEAVSIILFSSGAILLGIELLSNYWCLFCWWLWLSELVHSGMFHDIIGYCVIDGNYVGWSLAPDKIPCCQV